MTVEREHWSALQYINGEYRRSCGHCHHSERTANDCAARLRRAWAPVRCEWEVRPWTPVRIPAFEQFHAINNTKIAGNIEYVPVYDLSWTTS